MSAVTGRCRACAFLLRLVTGTVPVTVCNANLAAKPAAPAIFVADQKAQDTCALLRRLVGTTPSRFSNRVLDRAGIFPARSAFLPHKPNLGRTNSMQPDSRLLVLGVIAGVSMFGATAACAADGLGYVQTNLVSNGAISARTTDPDLLNAWGSASSLEHPSGSPITARASPRSTTAPEPSCRWWWKSRRRTARSRAPSRRPPA